MNQNQNAGGLDLGALVANAKIGVARNPQLPFGTHIVEILGSQKPQMAVAFVADLRTEDGGTYSYYKPLDGNPKAVAARTGEVLSFICAATGHRNLQEWEGAGFGANERRMLINMCLGSGPGPLQGRKMQITVSDTGKRTDQKFDDSGTALPTYPIARYTFAPVADS